MHFYLVLEPFFYIDDIHKSIASFFFTLQQSAQLTLTVMAENHTCSSGLSIHSRIWNGEPTIRIFFEESNITNSAITVDAFHSSSPAHSPQSHNEYTPKGCLQNLQIQFIQSPFRIYLKTYQVICVDKQDNQNHVAILKSKNYTLYNKRNSYALLFGIVNLFCNSFFFTFSPFLHPTM